MGENHELTIYERGQIIGMFKGGHTKASIRQILGFPESTI